jgi:ethanolamine ammonia-lyase small subunit
MGDNDKLSSLPSWPEIAQKIRERTPARIFVERGAAYSTQMQLELRRAHAGAVDAVWTEFDLQRDFAPEFVARWKLFQVSSQAESKTQFLLRPDLGRRLSNPAIALVDQNCAKEVEVQIVIGDGLSGTAVSQQVPALLPLLERQFRDRGWTIGQAFCVRYCRVGVINSIGELLKPRVLVLLIGERPGLATAESLSAYMGYCPRQGHTDADRNLISNIHTRGVRVEEAAQRITKLVATMMEAKSSGTSVKED